MTKSLIEQEAEKNNSLRLLQQERLLIEFSHLICTAMEEKNIKRSQLADYLGKTKSWVTQILQADANLTIRTIADIFTAMGKRLIISEQDIDDNRHLRFLEKMVDDYKITKQSIWQIEQPDSLPLADQYLSAGA